MSYVIAYLDFSLNKKLFHQFPVPFSEAGVMDGYAKGKSELEIGVCYLTGQLFQLRMWDKTHTIQNNISHKNI